MLLVEIRKKIGDFTLEVAFEAGNEAFGLLGASGSGKSMLLRCIAGIVKPDAGSIILNEKPLFDAKKCINLPPQQRGVGLLFQNYALFPNMTVAQNIACGIPRADRADQKALVARQVKRCRLEGLEQRFPAQLSGGQQQRAALARIFASKPSLLLLDEPFSALDSFLRWQLELELSALLADFGQTALFVSHNRDEAYRLCNRIAVVAEGRVQSCGEKWALFQNPGTLAATLLTGCKNISRAAYLDERRVRALDWGGAVLQTTRPLTRHVRYLGVRAHDWILCDQNEPTRLHAALERVMEDTFSLILLFRPAQGETLIRCEYPKSTFDRAQLSTPGLDICAPPALVMTMAE